VCSTCVKNAEQTQRYPQRWASCGVPALWDPTPHHAGPAWCQMHISTLIYIECIPSLVFQGLQEVTRPGRLPVQAGRGEPHPRPLPADANRCMRCLRMRCSRICPHLNIEMPLQWRQNQLNVTFNSQRRRCKAAQYIDGTMFRSIRRPAARCQRRPSPPHSSPEIGKPSDRTPAETGASLRQGAL
jgi:ferredoxin